MHQGSVASAFSIETVEDVLNLDLLPGVQVHKVQSPPSSEISFSFSVLHEQIECIISNAHSMYRARQDTCNNH